MSENDGPSLDVRGKAVSLADPLVSFEAQTLFADVVSAGCSLGCMWTLMAFFIDLPPWIMSITVTLGLVSGLTSIWLKTGFEVDNESQKVRFVATWRQLRWQYDVASFSDIPVVTVMAVQRQSRYSVWWIYAVALINKRGEITQFTDFERDNDGFTKACANAESFANHIGATYVLPKAEHILETGYEEGRLTVSHVKPSLLHAFPETVKTALAYFAVKLFLAIVF